MLGKLTGWDDTIVALATAPGVGAIAVVRLSGGDALRIIDVLFPSGNLLLAPSHTLKVGMLRKGETVIDEVVVALFKAPSSYTGEDVVEISCHGSPYIAQKVIEACLGEGARMARPGEFTQRAFLHGKLDLAQAEAVADLIASNAEAGRKAALDTMRGGFSKALKHLREQLLQFSALIELELDFSQEDVEFADRTQLKKLIDEASVLTHTLLQSFRLGNVIRQGVSVAIAGRPNAGKSTLLNALLNENRALVSDIAGTTRDTIEEVISIDGILFRLIDTAGIREHTSDLIESMGMEKSREKMAAADIVVLLFDVALETPDSLRMQLDMISDADTRVLLVGNKAEGQEIFVLEERFGVLAMPLLFISAKQGLHVNVLKERLVDQVMKGVVQTEGAVVTNARHYHALQQVEASLHAIRAGMENKLSGDLLAIDIRKCLHYLGEITGEVTNEDQLDYIFSKFCIGK
jgi:tRNA modification GTPase